MADDPLKDEMIRALQSKGLSERDALVAMAQFLNDRKKTWDSIGHEDDDPPKVPHPGIFQPDPKMVGDPKVVKDTTTLLDHAPRIKEKVPSVTSGVDASRIESMFEGGHLDPEDYSESNILGETNRKSHAVSLNPGRSAHEQIATLIHELTHVAGDDDDYYAMPSKMKALYLRLMGDKGGLQELKADRPDLKEIQEDK